MSIATFKKKTAAKYNNASVGQPQFSINGTLRLQGFVGQNIISRSFPRTLMRGNTERGYGGCCGEYYKCEPISPLCAGDFTNDPTSVKKSVVSTSSQLEMQYPASDFTTVKPDSNLNANTSQQYTLLQAAKTANKVKQFCKQQTQEQNDLVTFQLYFNTGTESYAYILIKLYASQLQYVAPFTPDYSYPSWVESITLYVNNGSQTNIYTDFPYVFIYPILPIDYSQLNLISQFEFFVFNDSGIPESYNYYVDAFTMFLGDLNDSYNIVNISLVSNNYITIRIDYQNSLSVNQSAYALITYDASQLRNLYRNSGPNPNEPTPSWISSIKLFLNNGTETITYTDFQGIYLNANIPIDYTQSLTNQFSELIFSDNGYWPGNKNFGIDVNTMYFYDLTPNKFWIISNITLVSGNPVGQYPPQPSQPPPVPQQHSSCNDPELTKLFTSNNNYQQRSRRCPTFTTKDASFYTSVSSSEYTASLQQQTACQDAAKLPQARISNTPPFGATVQEQPTFNPEIANYYEPISRNFYLNSVKLLNRCNLPPATA
jgi:hypothetical protein